jgi:hypothetical protein
MHSLDSWLVTLLVFSGVAIVCGVSVIVAVVRDGYRRIPDRSPKDRVRGDL